MRSVVAIMYDDVHARPNVSPPLTGCTANLEATVDPLLRIEVPSYASPVGRVGIICVFWSRRSTQVSSVTSTWTGGASPLWKTENPDIGAESGRSGGSYRSELERDGV